MMYLIFFGIIGWIVYSVVSNAIRKSPTLNNSHKPRLAQRAMDTHLQVEKAFMKNYMPFIEYVKALDYYYKNGGKKLTDIELNKYLSYPKHIYLNSKDEVICNGVNLGKLGGEADLYEMQEALKNSVRPEYTKRVTEVIGEKVKCPLFKFKGAYGEHTKYYKFKNDFKGNMIIDEYKFSHDYTSLYTRKSENATNFDYKLLDGINDHCLTHIPEYEKEYNDNKVLLDKYLSNNLKEIYNEFTENTTKDEMDRKLTDFYAKSNLNYLKELKEKGKEEEKINSAVVINEYSSHGWGNDGTEMLIQKQKEKASDPLSMGKAGWDYYNLLRFQESGYFVKKDVEKYHTDFDKEIIKKYDIKINY